MKSFLFILLTLSTTFAFSAVKLPRLISDGMVLQRDSKLKIWGWASPGETVIVTFIDAKVETSADEAGNWFVLIGPFKEGGPFPMQITGTNSITINDILIGDVWLCSGQSNMELTMHRARDKYPAEIANARNFFIRQFLVPDQYDFHKPNNDLDGGSWVSVDPTSIHDFSAVGYFFAKELYERYHVPIGLINSALGGSPAEAWMSEDALKAFPKHYEEMQRYKDDKMISDMEAEANARAHSWNTHLNEIDIGIKNNWRSGNANTSSWYKMDYAGIAEKSTCGSVWFQKQVDVPPTMIGKPAVIWLGRIVDRDSVFINGTFVGSTGYEWPPRKYEVPDNVLKEGTNSITVRIIVNGAHGGLMPEKEYFLAAAADTIDLSDTWNYMPGATMTRLAGAPVVRWKPGGLYNKMIEPLLNYRIKGVIWYQGESNAGRPEEYYELFPAMIRNWRSKWEIGNFPFLFVQLANYLEPKQEPTESNWAELRNAQLRTLSTVDNTAMAVIIDIGVWNDIHPLNKLDVGKRLALAAEKLAYGNSKVVYSGPIYKSMKVKGSTIELSFNHVGSGLKMRGEALHGFAIAGADKKFVWAQAKIAGNKVIVCSDQIENPKYVRYAWADNPDKANLYNEEGLPASPFTTDH